jgi:hypothetical protein
MLVACCSRVCCCVGHTRCLWVIIKVLFRSVSECLDFGLVSSNRIFGQNRSRFQFSTRMARLVLDTRRFITNLARPFRKEHLRTEEKTEKDKEEVTEKERGERRHTMKEGGGRKSRHR